MINHQILDVGNGNFGYVLIVRQAVSQLQVLVSSYLLIVYCAVLVDFINQLFCGYGRPGDVNDES